MELIRNPEYGACASIVFYQFAKALNKFSYEKLKNHIKTKSEKLYQDCCTIEPVVIKYWNGIHNETIRFKDMPTGISLHKLDNPMTDEFGIYGESEYGLLNFFCRVMFFIQTGYWIQEICNKHIDSLNINEKLKYLKLYNKFMLKYTTTIPYITYLAWLDKENIIENSLHVMLTLKINDEKYEIYNSNQSEVVCVNRFVSLWFTKDEDI